MHLVRQNAAGRRAECDATKSSLERWLSFNCRREDNERHMQTPQGCMHMAEQMRNYSRCIVHVSNSDRTIAIGRELGITTGVLSEAHRKQGGRDRQRGKIGHIFKPKLASWELQAGSRRSDVLRTQTEQTAPAFNRTPELVALTNPAPPHLDARQMAQCTFICTNLPVYRDPLLRTKVELASVAHFA